MCKVAEKHAEFAKWINESEDINTIPVELLKERAVKAVGRGIHQQDFVHVLTCHSGTTPFDHFYCPYDYPWISTEMYRYQKKHLNLLASGKISLDDYYRGMAQRLSGLVDYELNLDAGFVRSDRPVLERVNPIPNTFRCSYCSALQSVNRFNCSKCGGPRSVRDIG
jgi:hypothetical protein